MARLFLLPRTGTKCGRLKGLTKLRPVAWLIKDGRNVTEPMTNPSDGQAKDNPKQWLAIKEAQRAPGNLLPEMMEEKDKAARIPKNKNRK